ncbi:hypothetical protein TASIC1_0003025000 [Trichoderma asperellum]|uniref:SUZ domain-containing protein n=1 Tax=Trichoderma asperellum TaxID=101201 RepID=A0A6V8QNY2_TRIAP|nr:hypothetical protein TASIC1_0003025000 [Trichoderma asperellum]
MSRAGGVPNAWDDDDWETQADRSENKETQAAPQPNLSRQERLQQHAEANRRLWESAPLFLLLRINSDSKETFHYVEAAGGGVPLTTAFKPQVKVLSRKPVIAKKDPVTGLSQLSLDDDGDASRAPEVQMTPDEIRAKQKRDREEKQRRYDEARAKIFGESAPSSRGSSPGTGTVTPPRTEGRGSFRGRGRGRGGGYNNNSNTNNNSGYNYSNNNIRLDEAAVKGAAAILLCGDKLVETSIKQFDHQEDQTEAAEEDLALHSVATERLEFLFDFIVHFCASTFYL